MRLAVWAVIASVCLAAGAAAQPVSERNARKMLFSPRVADLAVVRNGGLSAGQLSVIEAILAQMRAEVGANYYGAVAVSPSFFPMMAEDPGQAALSGLLQIAGQYHSVEAAARAALSACEAARKGGQAGCVLAAQMLPRKYAAQPVQMSVNATAAMRSYRKGRGDKAMAISPTTPAFALARGDGAEGSAIAACNRAAQAYGAENCAVIIKD